MAYPRYLQVPPDTPGTYHCVSRCVRRAFLCGHDDATGHSFEHRKQWLETRIIELAHVFAVAVHAYAVMSNHFHLIIETDPGAPLHWSDEEVARRWLSLSPPVTSHEPDLHARVAALTAQPERLAVLRQRLGSLSWYMRLLKEPIARRANREDGCSGRFWEGRFRTQALLDDPSILASMVYVDLNPIRAGIARSIERSLHTSARARTQRMPVRRQAELQPLASSIRSQLLNVAPAHYLDLLKWTARTLHGHDRSDVEHDPPPIIGRLGLRPRQWCLQVPATESQYWRAIGQLESLVACAKRTGLKWIRGIGTARRLHRLSHTT